MASTRLYNEWLEAARYAAKIPTTMSFGDRVTTGLRHVNAIGAGETLDNATPYQAAMVGRYLGEFLGRDNNVMRTRMADAARLVNYRYVLDTNEARHVEVELHFDTQLHPLLSAEDVVNKLAND